MPLIDLFESMGNPEGYISKAARQGPDNSESLRDIYAAGALGDREPQVREGRGAIGSLLQGVGILDKPSPRPLTEYERYLYSKGGDEKANRDYTNESHSLSLQNSKDKTMSGSLGDILDITKATRALPEELLQRHPEYRDDAENYLKIVNKADDEAETDKGLRRDVLKAQLERVKNPTSTKDPADVYGIRWGRWRVGNKDTIDTFKTRVQQYMKMTDPEQKRIMGGTLQQMQQQMESSAAVMGIPSEYIEAQLGAELNLQPPPNGLGDMSVFPGKNPDAGRKITTPDEVKRQTDMFINGGR